MTKSTCLHIQDRESGPIRVVEIPWISVRIGRAAYCDVRLPDHEIADLACRLKRRGKSWQIAPATIPSTVWLDGQPLDGASPLPYDVPFQIGGYFLTLRQDQTAEPDWSLYGPPKPRQHEDCRHFDDLAETTKVSARDAAAAASNWLPEDRPREPAPPPAPAGAELATAPNPSTADILKRRWETRWRAAGVEIKSRAARFKPPSEPVRPSYGAGFESVPLKEAYVPQPEPVPRTEPDVRSQPVPRSEPVFPPGDHCPGTTDRGGGGEGSQPDVVQESPTSGVHAADVPSSPLHHPLAKLDIPMGDQPRELPTGDAPEPCSAPASFWDHWSPTDEMMESPQAEDFGGDQADVEPATALAPDAEDIRALRASVEPATAEAPHAEDIRALRASVEPATALAPDAEDIRALGASVEPATPPSVGAPPRAASGGHARFPVFESQIAPPAPVAAASDSQPRSRWTQDGLLADEWPSASEILAAHQAAQRTRPQPAARKRARSYELPTVAREPGRWVLPVWLAGPPFALFVLLCGSASCVLSVAWAGDSYSASIMTERLLSAKSGGPKRPLPEGVVPPEGTWVRTTAQHLAHWGFYQNALGDSDAGATAPDARALFERALEVSPINPTARLALAQLDQQEGAPVVPFRGLGLSRDALSLASSARWLFAAGRKDAALQMYRKALEIAAHRELSRYGAPAFSDDPAVPRYLLPGEDAVREILGTLVSQKDWTFAEWSQILPTDTIVPLVAARLLREESRQDAEELLELFLRADEHRTLERAAGPVLTAARAEAHALLSHWKEAEEEYHRAIELVDDDTVRRSWWFNLADIAFRLEDEGHRQAALRAALAVQTSDAISRRAADIQRSIGHRSRLRSIGAKAN